jgi:uncharacterized membrane protein
VNPPPRTRSARRVALWTVGAVIVAALLFAPITVSGRCEDAAAPAASSCTSVGWSLVGLETSVWLWLGATVVLGGLAWWFARVRR